MAESERKYEDIARKLATKEGEIERSLVQCTTGKMSANIELKILIVVPHKTYIGILLKKVLQPFTLQIFRRKKDP